MKLITSLFFLITLISCNHKSSDKKVEIPFISGESPSDNNDIFGTWSMCSTSGNGYGTLGNICQTIKFNRNGTGVIEINSLATEHFNWTLKSPGMKILYANHNPNFIFCDTFYYTSFTKNKESMNLVLRHNDQSYYLSK